MQKIQVLLADDNREFTHLLSEFIGEQEDMEIMGVAYNGNEVLRFLEQQRELPDVLILDIIMPHLGWTWCSGKNARNESSSAAQNHYAYGFWSRKYYAKSCATWRFLLHIKTI